VVVGETTSLKQILSKDFGRLVGHFERVLLRGFPELAISATVLTPLVEERYFRGVCGCFYG